MDFGELDLPRIGSKLNADCGATEKNVHLEYHETESHRLISAFMTEFSASWLGQMMEFDTSKAEQLLLSFGNHQLGHPFLISSELSWKKEAF